MDFDDLDDEAQDNVVSIGPSDEERRKRQEVLKQRSGDALKEKWRDEDRQELETAIAQNAPPVIVEKKCQVCTSEYRLWIERQLMMGRSYQSIANSIPEGPSRKSISNHYREHMALDQAAVRALLEEEADLVNQNYQEGVKGAITQRGMLEVLIRKGYQDMLDSITTIEPKDYAQFIKIFNEMNEGSGTAAVEEARLVISVFKEAIQNVLIKGDIIERSVGMQLLQAINDEVITLREEQEVQQEFERNLLPPGS